MCPLGEISGTSSPLPAAPSLAATCQTGDHHSGRSGLSFLTAPKCNRPTRAGARRGPSMRATLLVGNCAGARVPAAFRGGVNGGAKDHAAGAIVGS